MKKSILAVTLCLAALATLLITRTFLSISPQQAPAAINKIQLDTPSIAHRLSEAIKIPTLSQHEGKSVDLNSFHELHALLHKNYPRVFATLTQEIINDATLVLHWEGKEPSLKPALFLAHQDVVPADEATIQKWEEPPFSGTIKDGFIWGRGTLDFKFGVTGWLEAVEKLLEENFSPKRSIYFAFGHDEEIGGHRGAKSVAHNFAARGLEFELVLDEGLPITRGIMPGLKAPVALIGIAEKGYVTLELTVNGEGGHSSMPPPHTAVGILAQAITRLEKRPMPARISGPTAMLFESVRPYFPFSQRLIFSNLWLFNNLVLHTLTGASGTNALVRSTLATTMIQGSPKENVLPTQAKARVNSRILPGDTLETIEEHTRASIDMPQVEVRSLRQWSQNPSPISCVQCETYRTIRATIKQVFPEVLVAPSTVVGATDSRHFQLVSKNIYRFAPQIIGPNDKARFHGINERVSSAEYADAIRFYRQLLLNIND